MCDATASKPSTGGGNDKPSKKKTLKDIFIPTKESINKNKVAGAKFTAKQEAKGIGVARSNITDSSGNAIKGVTNSKTNPALVKLAKEGKSGSKGLKELSRRQSDSLDKDTSFTGIYKSISTGEVHKPVESLLEFGSKKQGRDVQGEQIAANKKGREVHKSGGGNYRKDSTSPFKTTDFKKVYSDHAKGSNVEPMANFKAESKTAKLAIPKAKGSNQSTASNGSSGPALATNQPDNLKNLLAVKKNKQREGKRSTRNKNRGVAVSGGGFSGLNIIT